MPIVYYCYKLFYVNKLEQFSTMWVLVKAVKIMHYFSSSILLYSTAITGSLNMNLINFLFPVQFQSSEICITNVCILGKPKKLLNTYRKGTCMSGFATAITTTGFYCKKLIPN